MKNYLFGFLLFFFLSAFAFAQDDSHVGEMRYSILTREQFRSLYGPEWDLMQGQELDESSELLSLWGKGNIPDARGVFLRCSNSGRDVNTGDPQGDAELGSYQADQFKHHGHPVSLPGNHLISAPRARCELQSGLAAGGMFDDCAQNGITRHHAPQPAACGGSETRPRCIIANVFIKLRESVPTPAVDSVSQMVAHPVFREAVKNTVKVILNSRDRR